MNFYGLCPKCMGTGRIYVTEEIYFDTLLRELDALEQSNNQDSAKSHWLFIEHTAVSSICREFHSSEE